MIVTVLVTGAWKYTKNDLDAIRSMGHHVVVLQYEQDAVPVPYESVNAVICNGLFLHHPIDKFSNLRYVQLTSAGFDRIPMEYAEEHNIRVLNARGVYSASMAEFAIGGVLQLYKHSRFFYENQRLCKWEKHRSLLDLCEKRICIVGCGSVGTECAKRFSSFGCLVTGVDLYPRMDANYTSMVSMNQLESELNTADVVVLTLPLTKESFHLMDHQRFLAMKEGAVLVNIARGAIVDTVAMIDALTSKLGGAVLDVFEEEPLREDSPLWKMDHVIVTPHNSFVGDKNQIKLSRVILQNIEGL